MEDPFKNAANGAEADFDFGAEFDANEKAEKEKAEREKKEKERAERKESIEKLFKFYREIVAAKNFTDIFGPTDHSAPKDKQLGSIKRVWGKLVMEYGIDRYNEQRSADPFPKEINQIAKNTNQLIYSFYEEATAKISGKGLVGTLEASRQRIQSQFANTLDLDIANAIAAEAKLNVDEEKEREEREKAEREKAEAEREQAERERVEKEERERAEREKAEREENKGNGPGENGSHEDGSENPGNANEAEKEKLMLGLSEKTFGVFKNYGSKVWDSYVTDLSGKNGQPGYLDKFTTPEKKANFLAQLVEVILQEKVVEKMSSLVADHNFDASMQGELVDLIIEQLKQDKAN